VESVLCSFCYEGKKFLLRSFCKLFAYNYCSCYNEARPTRLPYAVSTSRILRRTRFPIAFLCQTSLSLRSKTSALRRSLITQGSYPQQRPFLCKAITGSRTTRHVLHLSPLLRGISSHLHHKYPVNSHSTKAVSTVARLTLQFRIW
jgi:hypothetical protein